MRVFDTDWAYLAGIIDGEGSMSIVWGPKAPLGQPRIVVAMTTEQPVLWIYETFGGNYHKRWRDAHKISPPCWRYTWGSYSAAYVWELIDGIYPYLKLKRERAKEVMDHADLKRKAKVL